MGKNTNISWCDHTHNFWYGCVKVSEGCKFCYAERDMLRFGKDFGTLTRAKNFNAPLSWHEPALVFVCSWSDFFLETVPLKWLDDAWNIIRRTPHLTYLILTKRPQNIMNVLPHDWDAGWPNVWLGVTIENENNFLRMEPLADVLAARRFVSYEPALGPLPPRFCFTYAPVLSWLIAGGESGPQARLPNPEWIRSARDQCQDNGILFSFKQWGGSRKINGVWGGDELDGQTYHQRPPTNS